MGVRRAHRLAPVLEDLDPAASPGPARRTGRPRRRRSGGPRHDPSRRDGGRAAASSRRPGTFPRSPSARNRPSPPSHALVGRRRPQRGEVVREDERALVRRVALAVGAGIARAEVAIGVVGGRRVRAGGRFPFALAEPGTARPTGRDEHPVAAERIPAAVRIAEERDVVSQPAVPPHRIVHCPTSSRAPNLRLPTTSDPRCPAASGRASTAGPKTAKLNGPRAVAGGASDRWRKEWGVGWNGIGWLVG